MKLHIPCTVVSGRVRVLVVPRPPGIRVISFSNHHRALEAGNAIILNSWVFCDHKNEYVTYQSTGEDAVAVWETELEELVEAGMAVGPDGFGLDSCEFNKGTMLIRVVESIDVHVDFDLDSVVARLELMKDIS